jgi:hypothetical protein
MPARHGEPSVAPLHPFPEGWFFVASRKAILEAGLIEKTWMGVEVVAWIDEDGRPCVAEAICPHLGSDLGPAAGGGASAPDGWSAPSTAMSSIQPGSASRLPMRPHPGPRGCGSSRRGRLPA